MFENSTTSLAGSHPILVFASDAAFASLLVLSMPVDRTLVQSKLIAKLT